MLSCDQIQKAEKKVKAGWLLSTRCCNCRSAQEGGNYIMACLTVLIYIVRGTGLTSIDSSKLGTLRSSPSMFVLYFYSLRQ